MDLVGCKKRCSMATLDRLAAILLRYRHTRCRLGVVRMSEATEIPVPEAGL